MKEGILHDGAKGGKWADGTGSPTMAWPMGSLHLPCDPNKMQNPLALSHVAVQTFSFSFCGAMAAKRCQKKIIVVFGLVALCICSCSSALLLCCIIIR